MVSHVLEICQPILLISDTIRQQKYVKYHQSKNKILILRFCWLAVYVVSFVLALEPRPAFPLTAAPSGWGGGGGGDRRPSSSPSHALSDSSAYRIGQKS